MKPTHEGNTIMEPLLILPATRMTETRWGITETTIHDVRAIHGTGDALVYRADVTTTTYSHDDDDAITDESTVLCIGSRHGQPGPVVVVHGPFQTHVESPSRFGDVFDRAWAYRFALGRTVTA